jgi:hypothetical protein
MTWDSYASSGHEDGYAWGWDDGSWGLAELAAEQARGSGTAPVGSPPNAQPAPAGAPWQFGVKSLGVLLRNRWAVLAEEEEEEEPALTQLDDQQLDAHFPALTPSDGASSVRRKGRSGAAGDALRGLSLALPAQVLLLLLFARDLHHLGQAAANAALWAALCTAALARRIAGERQGRVAVLGLVLALPAMIGGPMSLEATDRLLRSAPAPTLSTSGQAELVRLLDENNVSRVVLCDYEASGALELLRPGLRFENAWGAASRGEPGLVERMVGAAAGDHLLVLRASAPLIYNRAPSPRQVEAAAAAQGLRAERVGGLPGGRAELYRILSI